jgi:hypothetical protein
MHATEMMTRRDLKRELGDLYRARTAPSIVDVPAMRYLVVDGKGAPGEGSFQDAISALYSIAYTLKFELKQAGRFDFVVPPLEALWWTPGDTWHGTGGNVEGVRWRAMIVQPAVVEPGDVERARELASRKRSLPALPALRFEPYEEGLSAQILHTGPYDAEAETIRRLHEYIVGRGYRPHLAHHEIYLSDPKRTEPGKLRTIIRQPMTR